MNDTSSERAALTVPQMARRLGCGRAAVYHGCKHEGWPHMRTGRGPRAAIRFTEQDALAIEELRHRQAEAMTAETAPTPTAGPSRDDLARALQRLAA